jgi:hypothetical protein
MTLLFMGCFPIDIFETDAPSHRRSTDVRIGGLATSPDTNGARVPSAPP